LPSGVPASGSRRWLSADRRLRARCIRGYGAACWRGGRDGCAAGGDAQTQRGG
jgi:hypothetical protein